jgi:hypothetical protein
MPGSGTIVLEPLRKGPSKPEISSVIEKTAKDYRKIAQTGVSATPGDCIHLSMWLQARLTAMRRRIVCASC